MDENLTPATDRKLQKLVRVLGRHLEASELDTFEHKVRAHCSPVLLLAMRRQKTPMRARRMDRGRTAKVLVEAAQALGVSEERAEYIRYVELSVEAAEARDRIKQQIGDALRCMPKLSLRQLLMVAEKVARESIPARPDLRNEGAVAQRAAEHGRQIHERYGRTNDVWFAVARAINEASSSIGPRDLVRADATAKAVPAFRTITILCSRLNSLEYVLDNASFGEFSVVSHDQNSRTFRLDIVDVRRALIRVTSIRRNLLSILGGRRAKRYVRERLAETSEPILHNALMRYLARSGATVGPEEGDIECLGSFLETLLLVVDAEDDLLLLAANAGADEKPEFASILYHLSAAIRVNAFVADMFANRMSRQKRLNYDDRIDRDELIAELGSGLQASALEAWTSLVVDLPVRSHFDLLRRPFIRTGPNTARAVPALVGDRWTIAVREGLNNGGAIGNWYGKLWEDFFARGFANSGWSLLKRNVKSRAEGACVAEIDMLLLRDDLLLVVEVKALTGSGISPYDHWKNREIIERGCRQARRAAEHIEANREYIASVVDRSTASRVRHVQPLVLTTESMFDGWEYAGVPVAGETIRKAITIGTKVE